MFKQIAEGEMATGRKEEGGEECVCVCVGGGGGGDDTYIVTLHCMLIIPSILLILYFSGAVDLTAKDTDTIRHEHPEDNRSY